MNYSILVKLIRSSAIKIAANILIAFPAMLFLAEFGASKSETNSIVNAIGTLSSPHHYLALITVALLLMGLDRAIKNLAAAFNRPDSEVKQYMELVRSEIRSVNCHFGGLFVSGCLLVASYWAAQGAIVNASLWCAAAIGIFMLFTFLGSVIGLMTHDMNDLLHQKVIDADGADHDHTHHDKNGNHK